MDFNNNDPDAAYPHTVTVNGQGTTQLNFNDQAVTASAAYTLAAGSLTRDTGLAFTVTYTGVSGLSVSGGSSNNVYTITDTSVSQGVTVNTGAGGNTVNVQASSNPLTNNRGSGHAITISGAGATLDPVGAVTVNDATGTSTVTLDDSGYGGGDDYVLTGATLTIARSATFSLTYSGIGSLTLDGGSAGSYFDIDSTAVATTVNAGPGGNVFHVSPFTQYLAASIVGPLALNGGGSDVLEFFDANDPNAETFSFDSVPMSLTLGSTGTIATFGGMGGGVYVVTNGFSTPDDQSGTVIFDPAGGPPAPQGNGPSAGGASARPVLTGDTAHARATEAAAPWTPAADDGSGATHAMASALVSRVAEVSAGPEDLIDQLFTL